MILTEPLQLATSNFVHILLMIRGHQLLLSRFKVNVTRYTLLLNLVTMIQTEPFQLGPSRSLDKYGNIFVIVIEATQLLYLDQT